MLSSMRQKKAQKLALLKTTVVLCIVATAACLSAILFGPLVFGDLTSIPSNSNSGSGQGSTMSIGSAQGGSKVTGQTQTDIVGNVSGDCILHISQCPDNEPNCLNSALFIRGLCSDVRCSDSKNICTPVSNPGPSGDGRSSAGQTSGTNHSDASSRTNEQSGNSGQGSPLTIAPSALTDRQPLGCYDNDGKWTTDRSACAENQSPFLQEQTADRTDNSGTSGNSGNGTVSSRGTRPVFENQSSLETRPAITTPEATVRTTIEADREDPTLQQAFREMFDTAPEPADRAGELLQTATNALERLQQLRARPLSAAAAASVDDSYNWISILLSDLATHNQTDEEIETKAVLLKERLEQTTKSISSLPTPEPRPSGVLAALDSLFLRLPVVFAFMQEEKVPLHMNAVNTYQSAYTLYTSTRTACIETASRCAELANVIAKLETLRTEISLILQEAGKTDLQERIDEMLR